MAEGGEVELRITEAGDGGRGGELGAGVEGRLAGQERALARLEQKMDRIIGQVEERRQP